MMYQSKVAKCPCGNEIPTPYGTPLHNPQGRERLATDEDYLNLACPMCNVVSRHLESKLETRLLESRNPYSLQSGKAWIGLWLRCERENCDSHVQVETVVASGTTTAQLKGLVALWTVGGLTCFRGDRAKSPPELQSGPFYDSFLYST